MNTKYYIFMTATANCDCTANAYNITQLNYAVQFTTVASVKLVSSLHGI